MRSKIYRRARFMPYRIMVDEFSAVNFKWSKQFEDAIEAKPTAEQVALKAQMDPERIKFEADQKIVFTKAEAESLRLQKENVTPQLIKLCQIEAYEEAIQKWDGHLPPLCRRKRLVLY